MCVYVYVYICMNLRSSPINFPSIVMLRIWSYEASCKSNNHWIMGFCYIHSTLILVDLNWNLAFCTVKIDSWQLMLMDFFTSLPIKENSKDLENKYNNNQKSPPKHPNTQHLRSIRQPTQPPSNITNQPPKPRNLTQFFHVFFPVPKPGHCLLRAWRIQHLGISQRFELLEVRQPKPQLFIHKKTQSNDVKNAEDFGTVVINPFVLGMA